ncbi:MAG: hypothetical protein R3338_04395 [Thermoanaerobaculia bacterium]|nr:hypothetical protein [Thermoanaerobaculia bacterium]
MRSRLAETVAMLMIGDGVLATIAPTEHVRLWRKAPTGLDKMLKKFEQNPGLTRTLGVVEIGLGIWLAKAQYRKRKSLFDRLL